eukprot:360774-Chlamydomonas_euryale.AAC.4
MAWRRAAEMTRAARAACAGARRRLPTLATGCECGGQASGRRRYPGSRAGGKALQHLAYVTDGDSNSELDEFVLPHLISHDYTEKAQFHPLRFPAGCIRWFSASVVDILMGRLLPRGVRVGDSRDRALHAATRPINPARRQARPYTDA